MVSEVPLSDAGGGVALSFEDFGDGDFIGVEAFFVYGEKDAISSSFSCMFMRLG